MRSHVELVRQLHEVLRRVRELEAELEALLQAIDPEPAAVEDDPEPSA